MDISQKLASQIPNWSKRKGASLRKGLKKKEMKEVKQTDGFEVHAFSDVHLHVMLFVDVFPCFPFHFCLVYQPYAGYMLRYTSCTYIYMYICISVRELLIYLRLYILLAWWSFGLTFAGTV